MSTQGDRMRSFLGLRDDSRGGRPATASGSGNGGGGNDDDDLLDMLEDKPKPKKPIEFPSFGKPPTPAAKPQPTATQATANQSSPVAASPSPLRPQASMPLMTSPSLSSPQQPPAAAPSSDFGGGYRPSPLGAQQTSFGSSLPPSRPASRGPAAVVSAPPPLFSGFPKKPNGGAEKDPTQPKHKQVVCWMKWLGISQDNPADRDFVSIAQKGAIMPLPADWEERNGKFVQRGTANITDTPPTLQALAKELQDASHVQAEATPVIPGGAKPVIAFPMAPKPLQQAAPAMPVISLMEPPAPMPLQAPAPAPVIEQQVAPQPETIAIPTAEGAVQQQQPVFVVQQQPQMMVQQPQAVMVAPQQAVMQPIQQLSAAAPVAAPPPAVAAQTPAVVQPQQPSAVAIEAAAAAQAATKSIQLLMDERERMSRQISDLESLIRKMTGDIADQAQRHANELSTQQSLFQKRVGDMSDQIGNLQRRSDELLAQLRGQEQSKMQSDVITAETSALRKRIAELEAQQDQQQLKSRELQERELACIAREAAAREELAKRDKAFEAERAAWLREVQQKDEAAKRDLAEIAEGARLAEADEKRMEAMKRELAEARRAIERERKDLTRQSGEMAEAGAEIQERAEQVALMYEEAVHERKRAEQAMQQVAELRRWRLQATEQEERLAQGWRDIEQARDTIRKHRKQLAEQRAALSSLLQSSRESSLPAPRSTDGGGPRKEGRWAMSMPIPTQQGRDSLRLSTIKQELAAASRSLGVPEVIGEQQLFLDSLRL